MELNGSFKRKRNKFSQISNDVAWNSKLSLKAKGLYLLIESLINIPDFTLYKNALINKCKEGESSFNAAWKELKDNGYLIQEKCKSTDGYFYYIYELLDEPQVENPGVENPGVENPGVENPGVENPGVENPDVENWGYIINTNLNNTNLNNTKDNNNKINNKERKKGDKKTYNEIIDSYTDNEELREAIIDFIKMRKLIKKPMTDRALTLMLKKLDGLSNYDYERVEILNQSISASWQGIFPLKDKTNDKKSKFDDLDLSQFLA